MRKCRAEVSFGDGAREHRCEKHPEVHCDAIKSQPLTICPGGWGWEAIVTVLASLFLFPLVPGTQDPGGCRNSCRRVERRQNKERGKNKTKQNKKLKGCIPAPEVEVGPAQREAAVNVM